MEDNRSNYLIKTGKSLPVLLDREEVYEIMKSSALLAGLDSSKSEHSIKPIARWTFPKKYKKLNSTQIQEIRDSFHIKIEGEDLLSPVSTFEDIKFPPAMLKALEKTGVNYPSPIQMQGIPLM
jgi:ATP-dependent RNA helicase DDX41